MEKLNSQMQIHELAVALNNNAKELKMKMEAEKAEKEKHQQEIKRLQDSIDGIKHSSKAECEALMQKMNSRLRDIESKYKGDEAEEEKDEEVELLDDLLTKLMRRANEKEKSTGTIPKNSKTGWPSSSPLFPSRAMTRDDELKSPVHSTVSSGTANRSIFRVPKPNCNCTIRR